MGQVLIPSASAAIIRFPQASDVLFVAHLNKSWRDVGGIPITFHKFRARKSPRFIAPKIAWSRHEQDPADLCGPLVVANLRFAELAPAAHPLQLALRGCSQRTEVCDRDDQ